MKFGSTLHDSLLMEWRFYAADYKAMKKCLNAYSTEEKASLQVDIGLREDQLKEKFQIDGFTITDILINIHC